MSFHQDLREAAEDAITDGERSLAEDIDAVLKAAEPVFRADERRCLAFLLRAVLIGNVVDDAMAAIRVLIALATALEDGQVVTIDKLREWAKA